jgi:hypothetical protein
MGKLMELGGEGVRKAAEEVDKWLVLSQKQVNQARENEIAVDNLKDAWEGLGIQLGAIFAEPVTRELYLISDGLKAIGMELDETKSGFPSLIDMFVNWGNLRIEAHNAEVIARLGGAIRDTTNAAEGGKEALIDLNDAVRALSLSTQLYLDYIKGVSGKSEDYIDFLVSTGVPGLNAARLAVSMQADSMRYSGLATMAWGQAWTGATTQAKDAAEAAGPGISKSLEPAGKAAAKAGSDVAYLNEQLLNAKRLSGSAWDYWFRIHVSGSIPNFGALGGEGIAKIKTITGSTGGLAAGGPIIGDITAVGEEGEEGVIRQPNGTLYVIPHEAWIQMKRAGIVSTRGLSIGGEFDMMPGSSASGGGGLGGSVAPPGAKRKSGRGWGPSGGAQLPASGSSGPGSVAFDSAIAPLQEQTAAASSAAIAVAQAASVQAAQSQKQTEATIAGNDAIVAKLDQLLRELPEAMQDAVKLVV